jgi:hypothetical protein
MRDEHIDGLLSAVTDLIHSGNCNPHEVEIAATYFGEKAAAIQAVVLEVATRLPRLRKMLEQDGYPACLYAQPFCDEFDRHVPATMKDAGRCLAGGTGKRGVGIHIVVDSENDMLWQREVENRVKSAGGQMATQIKRVDGQIGLKKLARETGRSLITGALQSVDGEYQTTIGRQMVRQLGPAA